MSSTGWRRESASIGSQPKKNAHFKPRTSGFGKISARTGSGSVSSANTFNHQTKVRPITPDSLLSEDELKLTKEQHPCSQNLGMATAFLMPLAMIAGGVAAGTYFWFDIKGDNVGLFVACNNWTKECLSVSEKFAGDSLMQSAWTIGVPLELTGLGLCLIGMISLLCYPCHRRLNFSKLTCAVIIAIILSLGTVLHIAGIGLFLQYYFGSSQVYSFQWSFFAAAGSALVVLTSCILFWVHVFYTGCFDT